jgi:hypothetical protein
MENTKQLGVNELNEIVKRVKYKKVKKLGKNIY